MFMVCSSSMRTTRATSPVFERRVLVALLLACTPAILGFVAASADQPLLAQAPPQRTDERPENPPKAAEPVERLGPNLLRVGNVQVDTSAKEISVRGTVNDVQNLEFLANTKDGFKAYESALELDTNAINFNLGLILIGLDSAHAVVPRRQFDPELPRGDPVEIWIEWGESGSRRRIRAEQLVQDRITKELLTEGPWVYTGSVFTRERGAYLADIDGTLIGFMHTPSPILENPRPLPGVFGNFIINPELNLKAGTSVLVTVRALTRAK